LNVAGPAAVDPIDSNTFPTINSMDNVPALIIPTTIPPETQFCNTVVQEVGRNSGRGKRGKKQAGAATTRRSLRNQQG
jgi:hypothetical protein